MRLEKKEDDYQDKNNEFSDKAEKYKSDTATVDATCKILLTGKFSK